MFSILQPRYGTSKGCFASSAGVAADHRCERLFHYDSHVIEKREGKQGRIC